MLQGEMMFISVSRCITRIDVSSILAPVLNILLLFVLSLAFLDTIFIVINVVINVFACLVCSRMLI